MRIIVLGHTGFVGRTIFHHLMEEDYEIIGVNSQSPQIDMVCDLVINCAGNSKKYLAEKNYSLVRSIEEGILDRLRRIRAKRIIHISSTAVVDETNYGSFKRYAEEEIKMIFSNFCILRVANLVGNGLSKNVIYDLLNNNPLYLKLDSVCNFIHTSTVAEIVKYFIKHWKFRGAINVAAIKSISVAEMADMMGKTPQVLETAKTEYYQVDIRKLQTFFETKDSKYYIDQYLKERTE